MKRKKLFALGLVLLLAFTLVAPTFAETILTYSTSSSPVLTHKHVTHTGWYITGSQLTFSGSATKVTYRPYSSGDLVIRVSNAKTFDCDNLSGGNSYWGVLNANSIEYVDLYGNINAAGTSTHKGTASF